VPKRQLYLALEHAWRCTLHITHARTLCVFMEQTRAHGAICEVPPVCRGTILCVHAYGNVLCVCTARLRRRSAL